MIGLEENMLGGLGWTNKVSHIYNCLTQNTPTSTNWVYPRVEESIRKERERERENLISSKGLQNDMKHLYGTLLQAY